jgi:DNA-binding response OmpR family regulator
VEDAPLIQLRLEALLESAGYSVTCVSSASQARAAVAAIFFPVVIIGRMLKDGDGVALCTELREHTSRGRVFLLILSDSDSQIDIGSGLRAGADAYFNKKRASDGELFAYIEAAIAVAQFASK